MKEAEGTSVGRRKHGLLVGEEVGYEPFKEEELCVCTRESFGESYEGCIDGGHGRKRPKSR